LFVCEIVRKPDGKQFLKLPLQNGARAALVEDFPEETFGLSIIQVADFEKVFKEIT
jgi:hypothetical protein